MTCNINEIQFNMEWWVGMGWNWNMLKNWTVYLHSNSISLLHKRMHVSYSLLTIPYILDVSLILFKLFKITISAQKAKGGKR